MTGPERREPLTPTVAHLIAAAIGTAVVVLMLGVVYLVRVGVIA
ncbi:hypothetical protein [Nocardia abscessus]|nr:hypothetical protein [Nocardia abscessus]